MSACLSVHTRTQKASNLQSGNKPSLNPTAAETWRLDFLSDSAGLFYVNLTEARVSFWKRRPPLRRWPQQIDLWAFSHVMTDVGLGEGGMRQFNKGSVTSGGAGLYKKAV